MESLGRPPKSPVAPEKRIGECRVATVSEKSGKTKIFQGQGKVREFCKKSGKILVLVKVSEKSGNFVFRLPEGFLKFMKTFSFGKLC